MEVDTDIDLRDPLRLEEAANWNWIFFWFSVSGPLYGMAVFTSALRKKSWIQECEGPIWNHWDRFPSSFSCSDFTVREFAYQTKGDKIAAIRIQNIHIIALRISTFLRSHLSSLHSGQCFAEQQPETEKSLYHWGDGPEVWKCQVCYNYDHWIINNSGILFQLL